MKRTLYIDIETFSDVDLLNSGMYRYAESYNFELLLLGYAYDDEPVRVIDVAGGEAIPQQLVDDLYSDDVVKVAHNAAFERVCLGKHFGAPMIIEQWRCTMAQCQRMGLTPSLNDAGKALHVDERKSVEGVKLINVFCSPTTPSKSNGNRTRVRPEDAPMMWAKFKEYCAQDVRTERAIDKASVVGRAICDFEQAVYALDQRINNIGIMIDRTFVERAVRLDGDVRERLLDEAKRITGLENPNAPQQLIDWLATKGIKTYSVAAARVAEILERTNDIDVMRVLTIRQQLSKTSTTKYNTMLAVACDDDRVRGQFAYYGARTGRWAGRKVQLHNMPKCINYNAANVRAIINEASVDELELEFGNITQMLSELVRSAFVAPEGKSFVICDYSAIEPRVLSWLAGEQWRIDLFKDSGKLYESTASKLFGVPVEDVTKEQRKVGKTAEIALCYQGGVNALRRAGVSAEEAPDILKRWRDANPRISQLWRDVESALSYAVQYNSVVTLPKGMTAEVIGGSLYITLPSGRYMCYPNMRIDKQGLCYGYNEDIRLYGGLITENIVQAIARDCLAVVMLEIDARCIGNIVAHIHDEVVVEVDSDRAQECATEVENLFALTPAWAEGLHLKGVSIISNFLR